MSGTETPTGQVSADATPPRVRLGQPAPPLHVKKLLNAPPDAPRALDRFKGKAVVLEFWGTWCAPCIAAFPHLNKLVEDTKDEPVVFIAITDEPDDQVEPFLRKHTLATWVGIDDRGTTTSGYGIVAFPTTVLIDPDGFVRGITDPTAITLAMLKDLANGRPLSVPKENASLSKADRRESNALEQADFLVFLGPPNLLVGEPATTQNDWRSQHCDAQSLLELCHRQEAGLTVSSYGSGFDGPQIVFECEIPKKEFGFVLRAPEASSLVPSSFRQLRYALEASLGLQTHAVHESRETDALVMKHVGPAFPPKAAGDAALGARVIYPPHALIAESAPISALCRWIESRSKKSVLDETGLTGTYDFRLKVKSFDVDDLNEDLKTLGLVLAPERRKIEYVVIRRTLDARPHGFDN